MSDAVKIGQITNCDVYLEGNIQIGRFKEFNLPDAEYTEVKHETLGQIAVLAMPGRPLKEMKSKLVIDFLDADLYPDLYNPTKALKFSLHSYVDVFGADGIDLTKSYRVVTNLTTFIRKVGGKPFKLGDNFEGEAEYHCSRFIQGIPGKKPFLEIDVFNQINNVNGVPVWSKY